MEDVGLQCLGAQGRRGVKGQESRHSQCRSCVVLLSVALHCGQWCLGVHNSSVRGSRIGRVGQGLGVEWTQNLWP